MATHSLYAMPTLRHAAKNAASCLHDGREAGTSTDIARDNAAMVAGSCTRPLLSGAALTRPDIGREFGNAPDLPRPSSVAGAASHSFAGRGRKHSARRHAEAGPLETKVRDPVLDAAWLLSQLTATNAARSVP